MLGFGVKFAPGDAAMAGQNERAFPVVTQYIDGKAVVVWPKSQQQARTGAAAAGRHDLQLQVGSRRRVDGRAVLVVEGLVKRFGGFTAVNNVSFKVDQGEILGLIGPNGSGKSTIFNMLSGTFPPIGGLDHVRGRGARRPGAAPDHQPRHRPHLPDPAAVPAAVDLRERGAGRLLRPGPPQPRQGRRLGRAGARHGRPADRPAARSVDGLGAAGLKKLELAKALATGPKLLLADESLGGLDETEMDQAADMLRRIRDELGITIIWVEHIMGVLMRVVDRVMVLDHGEKISEGLPSHVSSAIRA